MTALEPLNVVRPLPLRVEDFLVLSDSGAFDGYGKTELIDGGIVYMNAQHRPHARIKLAMYDALREALKIAGSPLTVLLEVTMSIPPNDAPEPDILLTSEPDGDGPAPAATVPLIVEISDTTLVTDLGTKQRLYARAGIPEYWVIDIERRIIHQKWSPGGDRYAGEDEHAFGARVAAATLEGMIVDTSGLC